MGRKKQVAVMLDENVHASLRSRNVNISALCNNYLASLPETFTGDSDLVQLITPYRQEIETIEDKIDDLDQKIRKLSDRKQELLNRKALISTRVEDGMKALEEIEQSKLSAALFTEMNTIIKSCEFNTDLAWDITQGIRDKLQELGKEITRDFFTTHVQQIKEWVEL